MGFDLADVDTRKKSSEGVWFDYEIDGEAVTGDDGETVKFQLYGVDAATLKELYDTVLKKDKDASRASVFIKDWSDNWSYEGEKLEATPENIIKIAAIPAIAAWVDQIANPDNRMAFMNKAPNS